MHKWPKSTSALLACAAGVLLGPLLLANLGNERWSVTLLAALTTAFILMVRPTRTGSSSDWTIHTAIGLLLAGSALVLDIQKLWFLAGVMFTAALIVKHMLPNQHQVILAVTSLTLIIPLPANWETMLATGLANIEASAFVKAGQLLGLHFQQFGPQILIDGYALTINQDCSGTLLLVPGLLGALAASATINNRKSLMLCILSALPLVFLINILRLGTAVSAFAVFDQETADSLHDTLGYTAMTIAWIAPLWLFGGDVKVSWKNHMPGINALMPAGLFIAGLTASGLSLPTQFQSSLQMQDYPYYVAGWIGEEQPIPTSELNILNATSVSRRLYTRAGHKMLLTAIYHRSSALAAEHSSERCFKAMGWQVAKTGAETLRNAIEVTYLTARNHNGSQAITEILIQSAPDVGGTVRLQLVNEPDVSLAERRQFAEQFAQTVIQSMEKTT